MWHIELRSVAAPLPKQDINMESGETDGLEQNAHHISPATGKPYAYSGKTAKPTALRYMMLQK